jgi:hypothetical protein
MKIPNKFFTASLLLALFIPLLVFSASKRYTIPIEDSPSWGPENAAVTIIEFIDYQ